MCASMVGGPSRRSGGTRDLDPISQGGGNMAVVEAGRDRTWDIQSVDS